MNIKKARAGETLEYTGIHSSPHENSEIIINNGTDYLESCVANILNYLKEHDIV